MVRTEIRHDGGHRRLVIDQPKANILSIAVIRALRHALSEVDRLPHTRLVTIEGAGDHFSYGASVEEHRADRIPDALAELHGLVRDLLDCPAVTAAVVRGRCLGGGFEVALACDLIFASNNAILGVPEIALGVFPPAAAALLPPRIGGARTTRAVLTGRTLPVNEWVASGLIELVALPEELGDAVDRWYTEQLAPRSAAALRCAAEACRLSLTQHLNAVLPSLEHLYLDTLMHTRDAAEGIEAFLEKRPPHWVHA